VRSRIEIDVNVDPRALFELARDVERWPLILPHYRRVTVLSRKNGVLLATMSAVRRVGPTAAAVSWRSRVWAEADDGADLRLRFVHVRGATSGMDVTWHITPRPNGCNVAIVHDFTRRLPFVPADWFPALVDRLFVRPIAGQTLATFKQLAEAQA
jgi:ribosome-associated toxin RatA of RatAB toxin-antitoxin module